MENQLLGLSRKRANELIHEHQAALRAQSRRAAAGQKMPEFYFDYVESPKINAWACFNPNPNVWCGFIGIYTGAVTLVYDVFYRMLAHPEIFPTIGDASAESVRPPFATEGIYSSYATLLKSRARSERAIANVLPKDGRRRTYAERLARIALDFFITHELSHITYGHCQYSTARGLSLLMERRKTSQKLPPLVSQALEFHADASAALETWKLHLEGPTNQQRIIRGTLENGARLVVTEELLMFDWVVAVFVMFWMLGQITDPNALLTESHPPPSERVMAAMADVYGWLKKTASQERRDWFDQARLRAFRSASDALNTLTTGQFLPNLDAYLRLHNDGVIVDHYRSVEATMQKIIPDVKKFAHCEFNYRFQVTADLPTEVGAL
ncbi:MAG: hypothetical protein ABSB74_19660 [Tepidisphaeraceae bacterium]